MYAVSLKTRTLNSYFYLPQPLTADYITQRTIFLLHLVLMRSILFIHRTPTCLLKSTLPLVVLFSWLESENCLNADYLRQGIFPRRAQWAFLLMLPLPCCPVQHNRATVTGLLNAWQPPVCPPGMGVQKYLCTI